MLKRLRPRHAETTSVVAHRRPAGARHAPRIRPDPVSAEISLVPARQPPSGSPAVPLGSLTQRDARAGASAAPAAASHVTRLAMNLTDGTPVDFTSCHRCEHRTWAARGRPALAVDAVLEQTRKR